MTNNAFSPDPMKIEKKIEVSRAIKNIKLYGTYALLGESIVKTYEVKYQIDAETNEKKMMSKKKINEQLEPVNFYLVEVSPEQIKEYRIQKISSFVLKVQGRLYWTQIPNNINFVSSKLMGPHICSVSGHVCARLSAAEDVDGGCAKVRAGARYIERYPWIRTGYETFATKYDAFVAVQCEQYVECPARKKRSVTEVNKLRVGLAQFVWDDVTDIREVRKRIKENREKG